MAATNYTPIQLYFSTTASAVPLAANLAQGELAINITDGKLYYEDNAGVVQVIATKGAGTIGGSTTQIQYNNAGALAGNAAMTFNSGTSTTTLTTLNLTNALGATYGGTAQSAYTQGDFLYASATNTLSKLGIGTVNYILTSTGSVPQWSAPSSIIVQTATNLAGGAGGSVPYQSAVDTTTFLAIGAANRVMTSSGTVPQWVTSLTGLTGVSSSSITNTSLTSGRVVVSTTAGLQADDADLTFDGTTLSAGGFSTVGLSTLVKTVTIGNSSFNGTAVFAAATPAKLYIGTGTVTDTTSAIGATNAVGAISSLAITPIAATNTSVTYTNAATLYIAGAPSAGTNVTLTNPYALYVAAGDAYFGGTVTAGTVNLTTLDLTNLEVTNIKAKDGTAAMTIADSTGVVSFTANPILSGGTANGVLYLNGSKSATSGSALTFDGTNLTNTSSSVGTPEIAVQNSATSAGANARLRIKTGASGATTYGDAFIQFTDGINWNWSIGAGSSTSNALTFNQYFGLSSNELMRLTSTGLGIGTSSPGNLLHVASASGDKVEFLRLQSTSGFNAGGGSFIRAGSNSTNTVLFGFDYDSQSFQVQSGAGTALMTVQTGGNVGIGTSSPAVKLDIVGAAYQITNGAGASGSRLRFETPASSGGSYIQMYKDLGPSYVAAIGTALPGGSAASAMVFSDYQGSWVERMRITSAGDVGIGVTSPSTYANYTTVSIGNTSGGEIDFYASGTNVSQIYGSGQGTIISSIGGRNTVFNTNGVERARIDSSGNVGIGTSSPTGKLEVSSSSAGVTVGDFLVDTANNTVYVGRQSSTGGDNSLFVVRNRVGVALSITGTNTPTGDGFFIPTTNILGFGTASTERMRIDSSGNLLVGTTSGSNRLTVSSTANDYISRMYNTNATGADMFYLQSTADPNDTIYKTIYTVNNATARFYVQSNGGIGNYQANDVNLSDRREKTNFSPAKSYLDTICAIPVQTFNYIDQNLEEDDGLTLGVVAQDVQAVAPELVMESNWGTEEEPKMRLSIYQTDLQYALMKCIQEQQAIINSLKARLDAANL